MKSAPLSIRPTCITFLASDFATTTTAGASSSPQVLPAPPSRSTTPSRTPSPPLDVASLLDNCSSQICLQRTRRCITLLPPGPYANPESCPDFPDHHSLHAARLSPKQTQTHARRILQLRHLPRAGDFSRRQFRRDRNRARRLGPADLPQRSLALSRQRQSWIPDSITPIRPRHRTQVVARRPLDRLPLRAQACRGKRL